MNGAKKKVSPYVSFIRAGERWSYRFIQEHLNRYEFASKFANGKIVLDVGCGIGYGSNNLLRKGAKVVVGGDISPDATTTANEKYSSSNNLHFVRLNGTQLPFKTDSFDLIVAFEVIEHIPAYESFLGEVVRCLKPDGLFLCSTPNKEISSPGSEKPRVSGHFKEFHIWELRNVLEASFREVVLYGQEPSWQQRDSYKAKMAGLLKPLLTAAPALHYLTNLVTRFVFKEYRMVKLEEVERLHERYAPVVLPQGEEDYKPLHIVAGARAKK